MSTPPGQIPESLAAFIGHHPEAPNGRTIAIIRPVSTEESQQSVAGLNLLRHLVRDSPLAHLRAAEEPFFDAVSALEEVVSTNAGDYYPSSAVQREFASWLATFGSFDDRNSAWLSQVYGKTHPHYLLFKKLLSAEYDRNFGYRACTALRNLSIHRSDAINDLGHGTKFDPATGEVSATVNIQIDGPRLATAPKMNAKVRAEFAARQRPLNVEWLLGAATLACETVHAGLLVALADEIREVISQCEGWHEEAQREDPDSIAVFFPTEEAEAFVALTSPLTLRSTAHYIVEVAAMNLAQAKEILSRPPLVLQASDFEVP